MKLIIAGSRTIQPTLPFIDGVIYQFHLWDITEIVSGGAKGVDTHGEWWAANNEEHGKIPIKQFLPDWELYGRGAGFVRNKKMAQYADALVLIWDGKSNGSRHMKESMLELKKPIYEIVVRTKNGSN